MALIQKIVEVYEKEANRWMTAIEVSKKIDWTSLSGYSSDENGRRSTIRMNLNNYVKKGVVERKDDEDRQIRFRILTESTENEDSGSEDNGKVSEPIDSAATLSFLKKYSFSTKKISIQGKTYAEVDYQSEASYENFVEENHKLIFGENSIYFPLKKKLGDAICDAIVYDKDEESVIIVENELSSHEMYGHVLPQLLKFVNALDERVIGIDDQGLYSSASDSEKLKILDAIRKGKFSIAVVIDELDFDVTRVKKELSDILRSFQKNRSISVIFKLFEVYANTGDPSDLIYLAD